MYRTIIFLMALFVGSAHSQSLNKSSHSAPATEKILSYLTLSELKIGAKPEPGDTEENKAVKRCVLEFDDSAFNDVVNNFLTRRFSNSELELMEDFMTSQAGIKYSKNMISSGLASLRGAQPEPLVLLSKDDIARIEKFLSTAVGKKITSKGGFWDHTSELATKARAEELLEACLLERPLEYKSNIIN